jgi:hypothetical protein
MIDTNDRINMIDLIDLINLIDFFTTSFQAAFDLFDRNKDGTISVDVRNKLAYVCFGQKNRNGHFSPKIPEKHPTTTEYTTTHSAGAKVGWSVW